MDGFKKKGTNFSEMPLLKQRQIIYRLQSYNTSCFIMSIRLNDSSVEMWCVYVTMGRILPCTIKVITLLSLLMWNDENEVLASQFSFFFFFFFFFWLLFLYKFGFLPFLATFEGLCGMGNPSFSVNVSKINKCSSFRLLLCTHIVL